MTAKIFSVHTGETEDAGRRVRAYVEQVKRDMAAQRRRECHRKLHERLVAEKEKE